MKYTTNTFHQSTQGRPQGSPLHIAFILAIALLGCGDHTFPSAETDGGGQGVPGADGTSCTTEPTTEDGHDYEIFCDDVFVGYLDNGEDGLQGGKGDTGEKGDSGDDGISCDVAEDGAYFVMSCGGDEKARWAKAMCGITAYDPEVEFCDIRDNKLYKFIKIDEQIWMAEDLSYETSTGKYDWATAMGLGSECNTTSCQINTPHRGICPSGWHLPNNTDWDVLYSNFSAEVETEFTTTNGSWWSATEFAYDVAYFDIIFIGDATVLKGSNDKSANIAVRCLKDIPPIAQ